MQNTYIIAEAGVNHNGSFELAKKLIAEAKNTGANAVKFQTFSAEKLAIKSAPMADYQRQNDKISEDQFQMLQKLELSFEQQIALSHYAKELDIDFLSSPFDIESIDFLKDLNLRYYKIPSGEITNFPYLKKMGALKKPLILSTGMSKLEEVEAAINVLIINGAKKSDLIVLQCTTEYPTPFCDVNLNVMRTLQMKFGVKVGFSDHTLGIEAPIAAVALGATLIEKHFTLDHSLEGPDHLASLEPKDFKKMVSSIRNIELALGSDIKKPSASELKNINIARKSIVTIKPIKKGELLTEDNISTKRPGNGISPMNWESIIGTKATKDYNADELL